MSSDHLPSDSPDIFTLSDRVLAEKLQFVKEVRVIISMSTLAAYSYALSDWLRKLGQCLVMQTESDRQWY
jgi:hypothetical protein